ncbi:Cuticle protein 21.3 [Anthophora quadrimaculata]
MAFKFVVIAAFLAVASAGGPAAYDISASSGDHSSIGFSQESTQKGLGGQNVVSSYSKSDDSAHSYVRVSSHSISNDGLFKYDISHTPIVKAAYTAPSYLAQPAAPLIAKTYAAPYSYGAPLLTKAYAAAPSYAYSSPLLTKTYATAPGPLIAKAAIAAPAPFLTKTYATQVAAAPLLAKTYSTPFLSAGPAPLLTKTYEYAAHAPVIAKSALLEPAHGYAASIAPAHGYAASISPAHGYAASISPAHGYTSIASAPLLSKAYATSPFVAKVGHEYVSQPQLISKAYGYEAASPVVHTVFNGLGTSYSW